MLNPPIKEIVDKVGTRYMLVNVAAKRARDIVTYAEDSGEGLTEKAVKTALGEIYSGKIVAVPHSEENE